MPHLSSFQLDTPLGCATLVAESGALVWLDFAENTARMQQLLARRYDAFLLAPAPDAHGFGARLLCYFAGELDALDDIPVAPGGTPFQQRVWAALRAIPAGQTRSYGQIARQLGAPDAARAVGMANGRNPISIVVPCHRLIGADGALTGYAGGLERKRWLLRHEGALA